MPTMDQVAWAEANIEHAGALENYKRGALLPYPANDDEAANRGTLRLLGAIKTVEVVYTPEELAGAARAIGEAAAAAEAAHDQAPRGEALPTLAAPGATPVVIGPEPGTEDKQPKPAATRAATGPATSRGGSASSKS